MLQAWHSVGALTFAGYILGFPADTPASIVRDIRIIQRELPIDMLEFFILTPLPGSQDHKELVERGRAAGARHEQLRLGARDRAARAHVEGRMGWGSTAQAWDAYYTPEHVETVIRRAARLGLRAPNKMKWMMLSFHASATIEGIHPLDSGLFRRKYRRDRRAGLPRETPVAFYGRYAWEIVVEALPLRADVSDLRSGPPPGDARRLRSSDAGPRDRARPGGGAERPRALHRHGRGPLGRRKGA